MKIFILVIQSVKRFSSINLPAYSVLCAALAYSNPSVSAPIINAVVGNISDGTTITIQGTGFTDKANPKPLFYWRADDSTTGITPSVLGRKLDWDDAVFQGYPSTTFVAPGSQQSVAFDHAERGAALSSLIIDSEQMYVFRKVYEDFDIIKNVAIRTFIDTSSIFGTINVGDTLTGSSSGATGVIIKIYEDTTTGRTNVFYSNTQGTVATDPPLDFINGETITGPTASMQNIEPSGTFRTFNFKIMRFWSADRSIDILIDAQGANNKRQYYITPENTDSTIYGFNSDVIVDRGQRPFRWNTQEVEYSASTAPDVADGVWDFTQNGVALSDDGRERSIITRTTAHNVLYNTLYQSEVSNGTQPDSIIYYDSLYVDDSLHHVVICRDRTLNSSSDCTQPEIQIPTSWTDSQITVQLNLGGLDSNSSLFLYVFDKDGVPNPNGFSLCPRCPLPPSPQ